MRQTKDAMQKCVMVYYKQSKMQPSEPAPNNT